MAYYTCPNCGSTYELREGMDYCPACREKINAYGKSDVVDSPFTKSDTKDGQGFTLDTKVSDIQSTATHQRYYGPAGGLDDSVSGGEGAIWIGLLLGIFLSWIGLIIAAVMKKKKTLIGAIIGFVIVVVADIVLYIILFRNSGGAHVM